MKPSHASSIYAHANHYGRQAGHDFLRENTKSTSSRAEFFFLPYRDQYATLVFAALARGA